MRDFKPLKTTCYACGKETKNPYSKRANNGIEHQYCYKCVKQVDKAQAIQPTLFK